MERAEIIAKYVDKTGKLRQFPAKQAARLEVLAWLADQFEPETAYPEAAVNQLLDGHLVDYAALRRYLVDYGFLTRDAGIYRRADGATS